MFIFYDCCDLFSPSIIVNFYIQKKFHRFRFGFNKLTELNYLINLINMNQYIWNIKYEHFFMIIVIYFTIQLQLIFIFSNFSQNQIQIEKLTQLNYLINMNTNIFYDYCAFTFNYSSFLYLVNFSQNQIQIKKMFHIKLLFYFIFTFNYN